MLNHARLRKAPILLLVAALVDFGHLTGTPAVAAMVSGEPLAAASAVMTTAPTAADRQAHTLVLTATGSARVDSLSYLFDGRADGQGTAVLPWRKSVNVPADGRQHEWSLTVRYSGGSIEVLAAVDGAGQARAIGGGTGTVYISGSVRG